MLKPKKQHSLTFNRRLFLLSSFKLITFTVVVNRLYNLQIKQSEKKITKIYFDRGIYKYHGRIKVFAETLRKNGMDF